MTISIGKCVKPRKTLSVPTISFEILACMLWSRKGLVNFFEAVLKRIPFVSSFVSEILACIWILLVVIALPYIWNNIRLRDIVVLSFVLLVYFGNILLAKTGGYLVRNAGRFIGDFLCIFVGISYNEKQLSKKLYYVSVAVLLVEMASIAIFGMNGVVHQNTTELYNMTLAYTVLPHACYVVYYAKKQLRVGTLILAIAGIFLVLALGTRGATGGLVAFIMLFTIRSAFHAKKHAFLKLVVLVLLGLLIYQNLTQIMQMLSNIASSLGMSTRIFDKFLSDKLFDDDGRNAIHNAMVRAIEEQPYTGYGIAGDRLFDSSYAHHFVLEVFVSYGIINGSLILIIVAVLIGGTLLLEKREDHKALFMVFLCGNGFLKLFMSSSYLLEISFFWMIGLCISSLRYRIETRRTTWGDREVQCKYVRYNECMRKHLPAMQVENCWQRFKA